MTDKQLVITLGGLEFHADLLYDKAPKTIADLEREGKFTSFVFSAKVCSNEITWNTPAEDIDYLENKTLEEASGNVVFFPPWGCICVFFGPTEPVGWCTKFAEIVPEERTRFAEEGRKVWDKQGGLVTTEFVEKS